MIQQYKHAHLLAFQNTFILNPQFSHHAFYTGNLITAQKIEKEIYFSLSIKALESIRLEQDNNKKIAMLSLGTLQLVIKAVKSSKQFNFDEGLYKNYIIAELCFPQFSKDPIQIGRKQIKLKQWTRILVTMQKNICINEKKSWKFVDCVPVLELGCEQANKSLQCKIKQIVLSSVKTENPTGVIEKEKAQIILHDGPLDTLPSTQIPNIQLLKQYRSPVCNNGRLFLCHDMEGGYKQDMNKHNPFPFQKSKYNKTVSHCHTYRNLHLMQAEIFNYFSHYIITIPPEHWRRLCRTTNTKCLGTYIVERNYPTEEEYLSQYTIKLLVYFCRKYRFDGYLINFQFNITNVNGLLLPWLAKLTHELHTAVPGSQVIWYDSVVTNGKVSYQNELNLNNEVFYRTCDGIFLNYWWNQEKLASSMQQVFQNKIIYVGSDCFGRGTFGGGRYNTHKAISAIRKIDNASNVLAPALFAMGFTYQLQKSNIEGWKINEKCMYRGMSHMKLQIAHNQWEYANVNKNGFTWQVDNEWAVTSFQLCKRIYKIKLNHNLFGKQADTGNLVINFFTTVAGTGPKFEDPYRITLRVSLQGVVLNEASTEMREAAQQEQIISLKINVDQDLLSQQTVLTVIEEGQDCQEWGGNYGSRFKNDHLYITKYCKENDWVPRIKTNFPDGVTLPYLTYYNLGHGHYFHVMGERIKKSYDYLSDYDANFAYIMNPPFYTNIQYLDGFMGGTCLQIIQTTKLKIIQFNLKSNNVQNLIKAKQICCRLAIKSLQGTPVFKLSIKVGSQTETVDKSNQQFLKNNWKYLIFKFDVKAEQAKSKVMLYLQSNSENVSYLLGQTAIFELKQVQQQQQQHKVKIKSLEVAASEDNPPIIPLYFDVMIMLSKPCKILFKYGQQFACFGWADQLNENKIKIKNVYNHAQQKNNKISIYFLDDNLIYTEYCTTKLDAHKLRVFNNIKLI